MRTITCTDNVIGHIHRVLSLIAKPAKATRPTPGIELGESVLTPSEMKLSLNLMRVNHAGEIAAQGLYQGQGLSARHEQTRLQMHAAAQEEIDHLAWCKERIDALGGRVSYLDPLWFFGSLTIGAVAGIMGDRFSLGFIAETEHQVSAHLQRHLQLLPKQDHQSSAILMQMQKEEEIHAKTAIAAGAKTLPAHIKTLMRLTSKIMVTTAYHF